MMRCDPDEMLLEPEMTGIDLLATLEVVADTVFGVDIDRPDQTFLPQRGFGAHGAGEAQDANGGDLHAKPRNSRRTIASGPGAGEQVDECPRIKPSVSMLGGQRLRRPQLSLVHDTFVAVLSMLHPVIQVTPLDGEQSLHSVHAGGDMPFQPVRDEMDCLTDLELVLRHGGPHGVRRRPVNGAGDLT
jgi:hypothetical protein